MAMTIASKSMFSNTELTAMLGLDSDYPDIDRLQNLSLQASQFILDHTGHDFSADDTIHPTALDCAALWIKQRWYEDTNQSAEYSYRIGIDQDLMTLKLSV